MRTRTARSARVTPTAKVTRPEIVLQANPAVPHNAGSRGRETVERVSSRARRAAESVPAMTPVTRTPRRAIR